MSYEEDKEKDLHVEVIPGLANPTGGEGTFITDKAINVNLGIAADEELSAAKGTWTVLRANPRICMVMFAVLLNGIICGIELNMAGNMMGVASFVKTMGTPTADGSYTVVGGRWNSWTVASLAQLLGMFGNGYLADKTGRRFIMYLIILLNMIGATLECTSKNWKMWAGAKAVMGLGTGFMQAGVSTYIGEVAPREIRGIALSTFNLLMNLGNLVSTLICYGTSQKWPGVDDDRAWRVPLYIMVGIPVIILAAELLYLVESPYWLLLKNKTEQCRKSLRFMYPQKDEQEIDIEMAKLAYTIEMEAEAKELSKGASYLDLFRGIDARRTFCATFPAFCQPLFGHVITGPYSTYFFSLAGFKNSLVAAAIVQVVCFGTNFGLYFIIDNQKIGRFRILFVGCAVMCVSMIVVGVIGAALPSPASSTAASNLLIAFVTIAAAGSVCGPGAAGWTYTAESGSVRLRAQSATMGNLGNSIGMNIFANTFPYMLTSMGVKVGFMFGGFGLVGLVLIWFFIPDYTGRSYAQIDELFLRRIPARKFKTTECVGNYGQDILRQQQS